MPYANQTPSEKRSFVTWKCMIQRCTNQRDRKYHLYGGRGIKVCDRWRSFKFFLSDMGERPEGIGKEKWTIDRIDSSRGYEPDNCRWAKWDVQNRHSRGNSNLLGYVHSDEARSKVSASLLGNKRRKGKPLDAAHKAKISAAMKGNKHSCGRVLDADARKRMSESRRGRVMTPEARERMSRAKAAQWANPEFREKMLKARRALA